MRSTYLKWQNTLCFFVSVITSINLLYSCREYRSDGVDILRSVANNPTFTEEISESINFPIPFISSFFLIDFAFASNDVKLHHFFGLIVILFKWLNAVKPVHSYFMLLSIYKTEISTIFYIFKIWLSDFKKSRILSSENRANTVAINAIETVNNLLFIGTFFKFRIWDYYFYLIENPLTYQNMEYYIAGRWTHCALLYLGIYGLYALNVYWFSIMLKIACKPLVRIWSTRQLILTEQFVTSFTMVANAGVVIYVYSTAPNESYMFDIVGCVGLSIASYLLHMAEYRYYKEHNITKFTGYTLMNKFVNDQVSIHIRCLLCVTSSIYYINYPQLEQYPDAQRAQGMKIMLIPIILHASSMFSMIVYVYTIMKNRIEITHNLTCANSNNFFKFINITQAVPITVDILIIMCNSNNFVYSIRMGVASWLCFVIAQINPFYELNHIGFHVGLILQSYYLAKCNLR
jgi:hypothetical protein